MKALLVALTLLSSWTALQAQEHLERSQALKYAFFLTADLKSLLGTPIPTDPDVKRPVAIRHEHVGLMLLPECKLSASSIASAGKEPVSIGQLWLVKIAPVVDGQAVSSEKLRLVEVQAQGNQATAACCALAVKKNSDDQLQLCVFGKTKEPLLTAPLKSVKGESNPEAPLDGSAEVNDDTATFTLKVLGKYQAQFKLGQADY